MAEHHDDLFRELTSRMERMHPAFSTLPPSDPAKIILEVVSEFAADLYDRIRPETERLFKSIPDYLALPKRQPEPTRGVIFVERTGKDPRPIALPKGTECFADTPSGPRRFVTLEDSQVMPASDILSNPVVVIEETVEDERVSGLALGIENQVLSLPVQPTSVSFSVRVDGDRVPWKRVDSLKAHGPADKVFRYDADQNVILFGDGRNGAIPGPAGRKIFLKKVAHRGSGEGLPAQSIRRIRCDDKDIVGVMQPTAFGPADPQESDQERQERFKADLFTQRRAFSLKDYERIAKQSTSSIGYVQALPRGTHGVSVVVAPRRGQTGPIAIGEIEKALQASALIHQSVNVCVASTRRLNVEARIRLRHGTAVTDSALEEALSIRLQSTLGTDRVPERPFGGSVSREAVRNAIERHEGVLEVTALTLQDGSTGVAADVVTIGDTEMPEFGLTMVREGVRS